MSNEVIVHKGRTNVLKIDMNEDLTDIDITSEIRAEPDQASDLLATWDITYETTAAAGVLVLTLEEADTADITAARGYMDLKKVVDTKSYAVFDRPLEVVFRGTVTE